MRISHVLLTLSVLLGPSIAALSADTSSRLGT
jgi:hypothetical protein